MTGEDNKFPILRLPIRETALPKSPLGRWFLEGGDLGTDQSHGSRAPWHKVLWLTGVDYFSTLGYQPGIALLAAGTLAPVATAILVLVTLFAVLPVYMLVAKRSFAGQGSLALLEYLLTGWKSKIFVLVLLGFAATDFVVTMTLSASDAALHAVENPWLNPYLEHHQLGLTLALLALLSLVFLKGFQEAIGFAMAVAVPYIALNLVVLAVGIHEVFTQPLLLPTWRQALSLHGDPTSIVLAAVLVFPRLALGMSGFETGVSVMPLIEGKSDDLSSGPPLDRIANTRKLLITAALIMSVLLLLSSVVTTLTLSPAEYSKGGPAAGRALAYLAHSRLGSGFGTLYDLSTILILWFAGASAMAGLLNLIPRYLPRFGMAPRWTSYRRPLVLSLFVVDALVTIAFRADVEAQGGAYATGVLVLMLSASVSVAIALHRERKGIGLNPAEKRPSPLAVPFFWGVSLLLLFTLVDNVVGRPDGVIIAFLFVAAIILLGGLSRYLRATELRVTGMSFHDDHSSKLWPTLTGKKIHLVPLRTNTPQEREEKSKELSRLYNVVGPKAFVHVNLLDNRSSFLTNLRTRVWAEGDDYVIEVDGAIAIANTIAFVSELLDPKSIFIGLTGQNLMTQSLKYVLFGEGETGLMIYTILVRYWGWTPEDDIRPQIFLSTE